MILRKRSASTPAQADLDSEVRSAAPVRRWISECQAIFATSNPPSPCYTTMLFTSRIPTAASAGSPRPPQVMVAPSLEPRQTKPSAKGGAQQIWPVYSLSLSPLVSGPFTYDFLEPRVMSPSDRTPATKGQVWSRGLRLTQVTASCHTDKSVRV